MDMMMPLIQTDFPDPDEGVDEGRLRRDGLVTGGVPGAFTPESVLYGIYLGDPDVYDPTAYLPLWAGDPLYPWYKPSLGNDLDHGAAARILQRVQGLIEGGDPLPCMGLPHPGTRIQRPQIFERHVGDGALAVRRAIHVSVVHQDHLPVLTDMHVEFAPVRPDLDGLPDRPHGVFRRDG